MKLLPCGGNKEWTSIGYEFDCDYGFDNSCEECVCCGGSCDPRYPSDKQPRKLSKFIIKTQEVNEERLRKEFEEEPEETETIRLKLFDWGLK